MPENYPLTPAHRLKLAAAYRSCPRVDTAIECAIEGQLGRALVDDVKHPTAFAITVGPFWYFAGDPASAGGAALMRGLPAYALLMPSTIGWHERAQAEFGAGLRSHQRFSYATDQLAVTPLEALLARSRHNEQVLGLDPTLIGPLTSGVDALLDVSDFESVADFLERSFGYTLLRDGTPAGIAYGSLVNSRGLEVSVFIDEPYRRQGIATALAGRLVLECLRRGLRPNWDAANPESCALAEKLGFTPAGSYVASHHV